MTPIKHSIAVGVFKNRLQAFKAIEDLRNAGFSDDLIGFIRKEGNTGPLQATVEETHMASITTGAVGGGVLGGVLGAAVALLIPGIGPMIAGGILGAALGGAALGMATGSLLGIFTGMGLSDEEARYYQSELAAGNTIVTVKAGQRYAEAQNILQRNGSQKAATPSTSENPETTTETYYEPVDVSATMPGPVPAPDIYTPEPILADDETLDQEQTQMSRETPPEQGNYAEDR
jgi:hypothetical protein